MANPLFPVSRCDCFTVISCLIVCVTDVCFIALYVVKREGYQSYRFTCRKGQALSGNKSAEMPVRQNAVYVIIMLSLWERMLSCSLGRLTVFSGLIIYQGFFFLSSFIFAPSISELAEWNLTISGHMVGNKCNLKMHVRNLGYTFPLQIGGPKTTFLAISQLKGQI